MCGSRKYSYPPQGWALEIPRMGRGLIASPLKEKYETKLEIPRGDGNAQTKKKNNLGAGMDIFATTK